MPCRPYFPLLFTHTHTHTHKDKHKISFGSHLGCVVLGCSDHEQVVAAELQVHDCVSVRAHVPKRLLRLSRSSSRNKRCEIKQSRNAVLPPILLVALLILAHTHTHAHTHTTHTTHTPISLSVTHRHTSASFNLCFFNEPQCPTRQRRRWHAL